MDLTDLNNWPDGAEACIDGRFTKWFAGYEYCWDGGLWQLTSLNMSLTDYVRNKECMIKLPERDWEEGEERMNTVDSTLGERGSRYGEFSDVANTTQAIKDIMKAGKSSGELSTYQIEALDMIASKIARIVNGDSDYVDNWHDIAGYARLVEIELEK